MSSSRRDSKALRDVLGESYERSSWVGTVLPSLFSSLEIGVKPTPMEVPNSEWESLFDQAQWLGSTRLTDATGNERRVWFAELVLKDPDRLRARVTLRKGLSKLLSVGGVDAVIAFFVGGGAGYRVTFASVDSELIDGALVRKETPPRRYSFALGPGEQTKTAAQRLGWLADRREMGRYADVLEAFSVEKLNKDFFKGYKDNYEALCASLARPATAQAFGVAGTENALEARGSAAYKPVRDFTKRMMGRLVFLKFVQRKGWLGADPEAADGVYQGGDPEFIQGIVAGSEENPYSGPLSTLFFEVLNTQRPCDRCPLTQRKVPYLNSGLFDPEPLYPGSLNSPLAAHKSLAVPKEPLLRFLAFLDEFNFTVDENSPDDGEVGVDPEMLGHIFENLLEDNKEKGAFYTPKAVVAHMCKEGILQYLERIFSPRPELARLVRYHDVGNWNDPKNWAKTHAADVYEALERIRVCDPACGSGAFPMGMLNELFWLRYTLRPVKEAELPELRKSIIRNNLHGVDLDAAAVEIARLRFWLSIVVDASRPEPLPNLDFRFLQGDSLVGFVGAEGEWAKHFLLGADSDDKNQLGLLGHADRQVEAMLEKFGGERKRIAELLERHFRTTGPAKGELANEILQAEKAFVIDVLRHARDDLTNHRPTKKVIGRIASLDERIKKLLEAGSGSDRDYFPWLFYENGGFDVVIANPPYISAIDHKKAYGDEARSALKDTYETAQGAFDIYVCFFELAYNLLVDGGVLTFITPNKWLSVSYAEKLRQFVDEKMDLRSIVDLSSIEVFRSVSVYPVITTLVRGMKARRGYVEVGVVSEAGDSEVRLTALPPAPDSLLQALPGRIWGFLLDSRRLLLNRLLPRSLWLRDKASVNAMTTALEADDLGKLLVEDLQSNLRVANTGTIDPFVSLWGKRPLVKQGRKFLHPAFHGTNSSLDNRRKLFETPKIIVAKMALRCEAFLDEDGSWAGLDVNAIYAPAAGYSLRFLIGYLHSDVAAFCHRLFFKGLAMAGGYMPFQAPHLRVLPIPDIQMGGGPELVKRVERAVGEILSGSGSPETHLVEINAAIAEFYQLDRSELTAISDTLSEAAVDEDVSASDE